MLSFKDVLEWLGRTPKAPDEPTGVNPMRDPLLPQAEIRGQPILGGQTGPELVGQLVDAIRLQQHVLIIGPRGCGKSESVRQAIAEAERQNILTPGAQIVAQGNKEFARDYFFEADYQFEEDQKKEQLVPRIRHAPLFQHASKVQSTGAIALRETQGKDGSRRKAAKFELEGKEVRHFVLFLDEINRFNDGVLDSLLLLLEERRTIYQGTEIEIPVTVLATMNPPGYDSSARTLSPPLLSRFTFTKKLFTAGLPVLVNVIIQGSIKKMKEGGKFPSSVVPPDEQIRLVATATLCFWGKPDNARSCIAYLSPETRLFLKKLYDVGPPTFRQAMDQIAVWSRYGPDARAAVHWLLHAALRAERAGRQSIEPADLLETVVEAVANKLVLEFSPDGKPEQFLHLISHLATVIKILSTEGSLQLLMKKELSV